MFRKGGSANQGVMHGLVNRQGYLKAGSVQRAKEYATGYSDLLSELVPPPEDRSLSEMLIGGGLNLVSGQGAGEGVMANIARSYKGPSETFFKKQGEG